jgi:hypothetical protein
LLNFFDSMSHYDTTHLPDKWDLLSNAVIANTGREAKAIQFSGQGYAFKNLASNLTAGVQAAAFNVGTLPTNPSYLLGFRDAGTMQIGVGVNASGALVLGYGVTGANQVQTILATSSNGIVTAGQYGFLEIKVGINATTGYAIIRYNEAIVIPLQSNIQTQQSANAYYNQVGILCWAATAHSACDFVANDLSGAYNNDFLGDVQVIPSFVNNNGRVNQFTPNGAGANWQCVSETVPDDDTTYNSSNTVGQRDCYRHSIPGGITQVLGLQIVAEVRKDIAGTRVIDLGVGNGTTESFGSDQTLSTSWGFARQIFDSNPNTSAAWASGDLTTFQSAIKISA